jgi:hypothetical protein
MEKTNRQERNNQIIQLHKEGFSYRKISTLVGCGKTTVHKVVQNIKVRRKISEYPTILLPDNNDYIIASESDFKEQQIVITVKTRLVNDTEEVSISYKSDPMKDYEQIGLLTYCLEELKKKQRPLL